MNGLSAARVLEVWEEGAARRPARRALTLAAAGGDLTEEAAVALSIPSRDAALLELRRAQFGDVFEAVVDCPACAETLEVAIDAAALAPDAAPGELEVTIGGFDVSFRAPDTADVEAAADAPDVRRALLERCICSARAGDRPVDTAALPGDVLDAVEGELEEADSLTTARLTCSSCGHEWSDRLDVAAFLWEELAALARRVTADVHLLASAYGWSEAAILALKPQRRRLYVEVVTA